MKVVIEGTPQFIALISAYHESLMTQIIKSLPYYDKLSQVQISVEETSTMTEIGQCKFGLKKMLINHQLTRNNPKFLYEVYGHELAHFLSTLYFNKNIQHGSEWVKIMKAIKLPPRATAPIDKSELMKLSNLTVQCDCLFGGRKEKTRAALKVSPSCRVCNQKYKII